MSHKMIDTINIQASLSASSKELRAHIFKRLRKTTGLSRKDFSKKYKISPGTLQNWETARFGGLTEKGANLMISALKCEQIFCSFEWLMYQSGSGPQIESKTVPSILQKKEKNSTVQDDLNIFLKINSGAIHHFIDDNTMTPHFTKGQLVAGTKKSLKYLSLFLGHICLVKTTCLNKLVLRVIKPFDLKKHQYHLIHLNPLEPSMTDLNKLYQLEYFAPIEWIRWQ